MFLKFTNMSCFYPFSVLNTTHIPPHRDLRDYYCELYNTGYRDKSLPLFTNYYLDLELLNGEHVIYRVKTHVIGGDDGAEIIFQPIAQNRYARMVINSDSGLNFGNMFERKVVCIKHYKDNEMNIEWEVK